MACDELARRPDVENRDAVRRVDGAERWLGRQERAAVQRDDAVHVRRTWRGRVGAVLDELVFVLAQCPVERSLETDRRGGFRAHSGTTQRARDMAGIDLDPVRECEQLLQASVQAVRAVDRLRGEVRASRISDQERVAGDHEPWLVAPRAVDDRETAVLRPVARRVQHPDHDLAERDLLPVRERLGVELRLGGGMHEDRRAVLEREASVPRHVIGVGVRLQNARDAQVKLLGVRQVLLDRVGRIDDHGLTRGLVSDQVGRAAEIVVDELPELHQTSVTGRLVGLKAMLSVVTALPGEELVRKGVDDLDRGVESVEALLVSIAAHRLARLGFEIATPVDSPELKLYELLAEEDSDSAHSRYNALVRRLVRFQRAAESMR
jgi:hypothetical protein